MVKKTLLFLFFIAIFSCKDNSKANATLIINAMEQNNVDTVTLGAGCFWCVEAVFQRLKGVESVQSGYSGGTIKNPSYKEICTGKTGHAEVIQIIYNSDTISFENILEVFFQTHDPTTLNRQGNDAGTQYRSVIFYHNEKQKDIAEDILKALDLSGAFTSKIVTEISPAQAFYLAEEYHQNYYNENSSQGYCSFVIKPKIDKLEKVFKDRLK
jgi:peptide-methionine (S)-S-oxide reductase